jgi:hypothetical protein
MFHASDAERVRLDLSCIPSGPRGVLEAQLSMLSQATAGDLVRRTASPQLQGA